MSVISFAVRTLCNHRPARASTATVVSSLVTRTLALRDTHATHHFPKIFHRTRHISTTRQIHCSSNFSILRKFLLCGQNAFAPRILPLYDCSAKRYKHRTTSSDKQRQASQGQNEDEEEGEEEDEEAEGDDGDVSGIHFKEDDALPLNYKEIKVHLKSPRLDAVVSAGLGIARNQIDDIFYGSRLKLNGDRVLKKSKQLKVGDYVDVIVSAESGATKAKRVRILKISDSRTNGEKLKIYLRAWRSPNTVA